MNKSCCGVAGFLFGHKFKARYDETETHPEGAPKRLEAALQPITHRPNSILLDNDVETVGHITSAFQRMADIESFYIQDVCQRCGEIVERIPEPVENPEPEELLKSVVERVKGIGPFERTKLMSTVAELCALIPPSSVRELAGLVPSSSAPEVVPKAEEKKAACPKCFLVFSVGANCPDTMICPKCATQFSTVVKV